MRMTIVFAALLPIWAAAAPAQNQESIQNTTQPVQPTPPLNPPPAPSQQPPARIVTPEQPDAPQPQPVPRNEDNSPAETGDDQPPKR